jgi:hypothetical protein
MNPQPPLAAIPHVPITQKQRWLYWNVPANVAAIWVRHGRNQIEREIAIEWEELKWPIDRPLEVTESLEQLDRTTCVLVGINHNHASQMVQNLIVLKSLTGSVLPQGVTPGIDTGRTRKQTNVFLIVACFECDKLIKSSLLELGADYVIDRIDSVPTISRMLARNGRTFQAAPHRFLPSNAV